MVLWKPILVIRAAALLYKVLKTLLEVLKTHPFPGKPCPYARK